MHAPRLLVYKIIEQRKGKRKKKKEKKKKQICEDIKHCCPETPTVHPSYISVKRCKLQQEKLRESQSIDLQFKKQIINQRKEVWRNNYLEVHIDISERCGAHTTAPSSKEPSL